ncbi:hypothetical protein Bbelb_210330 [Branchiostoma belcheri]|nr:hypothetical protein Bbelb_210330 [Branchiostoma belcheri]
MPRRDGFAADVVCWGERFSPPNKALFCPANSSLYQTNYAGYMYIGEHLPGEFGRLVGLTGRTVRRERNYLPAANFTLSFAEFYDPYSRRKAWWRLGKLPRRQNRPSSAKLASLPEKKYNAATPQVCEGG